MLIKAIVQARMNSSRLRGKSLMDVEGKPLLERVVSRVEQAKLLDRVVIATTLSEPDGTIGKFCVMKGWDYHRGVEGKVLEQFYDIATEQGLDAVVRITADCAVVDAGLIDKVIEKFLHYYPDIDYGSNILPRTYPRGLDVEVIKYETLEREWRESVNWRNHVTMDLRKHYWDYRTCNKANDINYSYMRWVVDTAEDLEFIRKIYRQISDRYFGWQDILGLLAEHRDWAVFDTQEDPE